MLYKNIQGTSVVTTNDKSKPFVVGSTPVSGINDGVMTLKDSNNNILGSFSANSISDVDIILPSAVAPPVPTIPITYIEQISLTEGVDFNSQTDLDDILKPEIRIHNLTINFNTLTNRSYTIGDNVYKANINMSKDLPSNFMHIYSHICTLNLSNLTGVNIHGHCSEYMEIYGTGIINELKCDAEITELKDNFSINNLYVYKPVYINALPIIAAWSGNNKGSINFCGLSENDISTFPGFSSSITYYSLPSSKETYLKQNPQDSKLYGRRDGSWEEITGFITSKVSGLDNIELAQDEATAKSESLLKPLSIYIYPDP